MKDLYTIGETATLLSITTQTLRHYDKIGLLSPCFVDTITGYRYYAFHQFRYIDRIKYLQGFGLSLEHIKEIISDGSVDRLLLFLEKQVQKSQEEIKGIEKRIKDMEWYIDYFTYMDKNRSSGYLFKVKIDTRYIITTPCYKGQDCRIWK